ncbi:MAG TPA: hypothetical protein VMS54_12750 [Vicinamibacterales bacterium]|nr:hypothetical protein [Vicinamibacterales bacterium]
MRTVVVVIVQILLSLFVTASVMPLVLITTPAAQASPAVGMGLMAAIVVVAFTLIALAWPKRLR